MPSKIIYRTCTVCNCPYEAPSRDTNSKFCDNCHPAKIKAREAELHGVTCQICGAKFKTLNNHIRKVHGINADEYRTRFPGHKTVSDKYSQELSEQMSGENNPWHNHGGKLSPFSKDFIKYQDLSEEEIQLSIQQSKEKVKETKTPASYTNKIEYYLERGMSEKEAMEALSERQRTFTLEKCIAKYGEEQGFIVWKKRQDDWQATLDSKTGEEKYEINRKKLYKNGMVSKAELTLFTSLKEIFPEIESQFIIKREDSPKNYLYDIRLGNKIIEYNGDLWHANPRKYRVGDLVKFPGNQMLAEDMWEKDKLKIDLAHRNGFQTLIIWEHDFNKFKAETIEKCKQFLSS